MSFRKKEMTAKGLQLLRGVLKQALKQFKGQMTKADRQSLKTMLKTAKRPDSRLTSPKSYHSKIKRLNPSPYKKQLMKIFADPNNKNLFRSYDPQREIKEAKKEKRTTDFRRMMAAGKRKEQRRRLTSKRENLKPVKQPIVKVGTIPVDTAVRNVRTYGSRIRDSDYGPMQGTPRTLIRGFSNSLRNPNIIKKEESRNNLPSSTSRPQGEERNLSSYHTPTRNASTASSTDIRNAFGRASDNAGSAYRYTTPVSPAPLSFTPASVRMAQNE